MTPDTPHRADRLQRAQQHLQAGEFAIGLKLAEEMLADAADDTDALYLATVAARYLKDYDTADRYLPLLHQASPEYGRAWQEAGHLARAKNHPATALEAFRRLRASTPL